MRVRFASIPHLEFIMYVMHTVCLLFQLEESWNAELYKIRIFIETTQRLHTISTELFTPINSLEIMGFGLGK